MILAGRPARILLIDTNVYFSKRLSDALKREGFDVTCSTQPSFALTMLEYDAPTAIVCSTNMREMGALDIARLVRADAKNANLPIIALGDGSQRALMQAFQAGCDDYIDRSRPPAVIATHVRNIIISKAEGFQPTQMLPQADTSLSGSLTHHDLPGVMQMLGHAHQTGALHINSGDTDALLFFDAGEIVHAECGALFGDEAVIHMLKSCMRNNSGVYKFAYGSASAQRTVLRSATDLMLDAMREIDESARAQQQSPELSAVPGLSQASAEFAPAGEPASFAEPAETPSTSSAELEFDYSPIATVVKDLYATMPDAHPLAAAEPTQEPNATLPAQPETQQLPSFPEPSEFAALLDDSALLPASEADLFASARPTEYSEHAGQTTSSEPDSPAPESPEPEPELVHHNFSDDPFANYSIAPFDIEEIT